MQLVVSDKNSVIDTYFANWLVTCIRLRILSNLTHPKTVIWNKYLNEDLKDKKTYNRDYSVSEIFVIAANNLTYTLTDGVLRIQVNPSLFVPGFDRVNLSTLVKTINYGTKDKQGCPVILEAYRYFSNNIDHYLYVYNHSW